MLLLVSATRMKTDVPVRSEHILEALCKKRDIEWPTTIFMRDDVVRRLAEAAFEQARQRDGGSDRDVEQV